MANKGGFHNSSELFIKAQSPSVHKVILGAVESVLPKTS